MSLRSFFGRSLMRTSAPTRSYNLNMPQGPSKDLSEWFTERFSSQPDSINRIMNLIYTQSPSNNVTPFNLFCRSSLERWTIKGLRVGPKEKTAHKRHVVVASGIQASERIPVGVTLYVAAALSRKPIPGVEVSFFPVLKPKEFELQWHNEQTSHAKSSLGLPLGTEDPINLSLEEYERGVDAPLRNYAMRRGSNFVDVVMDLAHTGSTLQLKHNSLTRPKRQADLAMHNFPSHPQLAMPGFAEEGTQSLFDQLISPPTVILELRDKERAMDEDQIVQCGQQVIRTIHNLLEETNGTKPLL